MNNTLLYTLNGILPLALSLLAAWPFIRNKKPVAGLLLGGGLVAILSCAGLFLILRVTRQNCLLRCLATGNYPESQCQFFCGENIPMTLLLFGVGYWLVDGLLFFGLTGAYILVPRLLKNLAARRQVL